MVTLRNDDDRLPLFRIQFIRPLRHEIKLHNRIEPKYMSREPSSQSRKRETHGWYVFLAVSVGDMICTGGDLGLLVWERWPIEGVCDRLQVHQLYLRLQGGAEN